METKEILKYRREADFWLCPACETENSMLVGRCSLCGYTRSSGAVILNKWTPEEDNPRPNVAPSPDRNPVNPPVSYGDGYSSSPESSGPNDGVKLFIGILAVAVFVVLIIGLITSASASAESYQCFNNIISTYLGNEVPFKLLT